MKTPDLKDISFSAFLQISSQNTAKTGSLVMLLIQTEAKITRGCFFFLGDSEPNFACSKRFRNIEIDLKKTREFGDSL